MRCLNEMPEMLSQAINAYQDRKRQQSSKIGSQESVESGDGVDIEGIFGKVLKLYADYSDVLIAYKKTKFMQDLYNDIKQLISKVKVILLNELDSLKSKDFPGCFYDVLRYVVLML